MSTDGNPGRREVAYRLFAAEFEDAEFSYSESDEERAPNYVVSPTGGRINRLFAAGVLTEVEDVNPEMVRGRVVDPTGAFVTYAGQYQPDALTFLERTDPPAFVALSGKARTFEPEDGDRIFTSVRPESVNEIDAETRDRWVVSTAERTLERIGLMAAAIKAGLTGDELRTALVEEGVDDRLADGIALALEYYGTTPSYLDALRDLAIDAVRVVAGELETAGSLDVAPDESNGPVDVSTLSTLDLAPTSTPEPTASPHEDRESPGDSAVTAETDVEPESTAETEIGHEPTPETESTPESEPERAADAESRPGVEGEGESALESESEAEGRPGIEDELERTDDLDVEDELDEFDPGEFELDDETRREVEETYGTEFSTADDLDQGEAVEEPETTPTEPATEAGSVTEAEPATEAESGDVLEPTAEAESVESGEPSLEETEPEPAPSTGASDSEPDSTEPEHERDQAAEAEPAAESSESAEEPSTATEEPAEPVAESAEQAAEPSEDEIDLEEVVVDAMVELDDGDGAPHDELVEAVESEYGIDPNEVEDAIQNALMSGRCYEPADGRFKPI